MKDEKSPEYQWARQKMAEECLTVDCPPADPVKDFRRDPTGYYVLIRAEEESAVIALAVCDKDHRIVAVFRGAKGSDVYQGLLKKEKELGADWFREKTHLAYIGKELKKAEDALRQGAGSYYQE